MLRTVTIQNKESSRSIVVAILWYATTGYVDRSLANAVGSMQKDEHTRRHCQVPVWLGPRTLTAQTPVFSSKLNLPGIT